MATEEKLGSAELNNTWKDIKLPNEWVLYLYHRTSYKQLINKPGFYGPPPHKEIYTLKTMNDLIYLIKLLEYPADPNHPEGLRNLDQNDLIIMRKGIEPMWEDPKNKDGGTFTVKMNHQNGFVTWELFVMYMLGETLTPQMENINGISVSYISDININTNNNNCSSYIKIWDAKKGRTLEEFKKILPMDIYNLIKTESLRYSANVEKKDYGDGKIIGKLQNQSRERQTRKIGFR